MYDSKSELFGLTGNDYENIIHIFHFKQMNVTKFLHLNPRSNRINMLGKIDGAQSQPITLVRCDLILN